MRSSALSKSLARTRRRKGRRPPRDLSWGGCRQCAQCRAERENLCAHPRNLWRRARARRSFGNYVLVDHPKRHELGSEPLSAPFAATLSARPHRFSALKKAAPVDARTRSPFAGGWPCGRQLGRLWNRPYRRGSCASKRKRPSRPARRLASRGPSARDTWRTKRRAFSSNDSRRRGAAAPIGAPLSSARRGASIFMVGVFGGSIGIPLATLLAAHQHALAQPGRCRFAARVARKGKVKPVPIETGLSLANNRWDVNFCARTETLRPGGATP